MLDQAIDSIPPGAWAVGVSGGADSVALLVLARERRPDVAAHVVHLDHQARGADSDADAASVAALAARLGVPCTTATLGDVRSLLGRAPANRSALYRAARLALLKRVASEQGLSGALYAHHADDQAETVLLRLLRGGGWRGLTGMARSTTVGGLRVVRPLLDVRRDELRAALRARGQPWREDASNANPRYLRNRARMLLRGRDDLTAALLDLGRRCAALRAWADAAAPVLPERAPVSALYDLPGVLRAAAAARWLRARGVPPGKVDNAVVARLLAMVDDAASPGVQVFPGNVRVQRARGRMSTDAGA